MLVDEPLLAVLSTGTRTRADGRPRATPCSIREVVAHVFNCEAVFVAYRLVDAPLEDPQPRLRKPDAARARCRVLVADVDTPGHAPWTEDTLISAQFALHEAPLLQSCAWYLTPRGIRLLQPLSDWIPAAQYDEIHRAWTARIAAIDPLFESAATEAHDWTHLYRPACCLRRDGTRYSVQHYGALAATRARVAALLDELAWLEARSLDCTAIDPPTTLATHTAPPRTVAHDAPVRQRGRPSALSLDRVDAIARNAGRAIALFVRERWHDCYLALAGALYDSGCPAPHLEDALALAHAQDPGWERLEPDRRAAARSTIERARARQPYRGRTALRRDWPLVARAVVPPPPRRTVTTPPATTPIAHLRQVIERSTAPLTVVVAPPGAGKTNAVLTATRRERWALSVPTNALAEQCQRHSPASIERLFSPPSLRTPNGAPVCQIHDAASAIAQTRIGVRRTLCRRCEHEPSCAAAAGRLGPTKSTLVVAPHALLRNARERAHKRAAIVVDEPPFPVVVTRYSRAQLALLRGRLLAFDDATRTRVELALADLETQAVDEWRRVSWPPTLSVNASSFDVAASLHSPAIRSALGEAFALALPLLDASVETFAAIRLNGESVELAALHPVWVDCLRPDRDQRVVVLDASADAWLPILDAFSIQHAVERLDARPFCRYDRVLVHSRAATRAIDESTWRSLATIALDAARAAGARRIGLITTLAAEPWARALDPSLVIGHYGAVRGLNSWADCDALITVVDPRPNLDHARAIASFTAAVARPIDADALVHALAVAELEQAHGRLRVVHRSHPALSIHCGTLAPPDWTDPIVLSATQLPPGGDISRTLPGEVDG